MREMIGGSEKSLLGLGWSHQTGISGRGSGQEEAPEEVSLLWEAIYCGRESGGSAEGLFLSLSEVEEKRE